MMQRNWIDLSRKLVDRYDFTYTLAGMSEILGKQSLSFFGEGVLATTQFPNPFPIVTNNANMNGTVGPGIAYDPSGNFTSIPSGTPSFTIPAAHATLARWDLLVMRYRQVGDSLVPKPSDPITMVYLNLLDSYELAVIPGTPSGSPAYPAKGVNDIILAGIQVPANATISDQCFIDLTIRELGEPDIVKNPVFKQERLIGTVNGSNKIFTTSLDPATNSLVIFLDGSVDKDISISGNQVTFVTAPALGQVPYAFYVVLDPTSINPLALAQETPVGLVNGINDTFALAGTPANKPSTFVFVDGSLVEGTQWSLIQAPTQTSIKFVPGEIPYPGQSVYVIYFVNPATVGVSPGGGGGGGSAWVPAGSIGAPLIINPASGIAVNSDPRQLKFVASSGGQQNITAAPQISAGTDIGQELLLKGTSVSNYMTLLQGGAGVSINGDCDLVPGQSLLLFWNGAVWEEISRRM